MTQAGKTDKTLPSGPGGIWPSRSARTGGEGTKIGLEGQDSATALAPDGDDNNLSRFGLVSHSLTHNLRERACFYECKWFIVSISCDERRVNAKGSPSMNDGVLPTRTLELLRKYDTPTICNVIELFGVRPRNSGYMDSSIRSCFPELPPMVGCAATATFRSAAPAGDNAYSTLDQQVAAFSEVPGPPVVVFEDLDDPCTAATFGEIMCATYKAFGATGLVTSGAGRDLQQVQALQFPVFTNGAICAHGYCHIPFIQIPVEVGGVTIHPGDLLHGDRNGVTTIPLEIASDVADACREFIRAESVVLDYLKGDDITTGGLARAAAECERMIDALREQVSRRPSGRREGGP